MDLRTSILLAGMMTKPEPYEKVDYIQSRGTQYIDTGVSAPNGFRFEVCLNILNGRGRDTIIGSHNVSSPYERNFIALNKDNFNLQFGLGNNFFNVSTPPKNTYIVLTGNTYNDGQNNILKLNDTTIYNSNRYSNGSRSANNLLLFTNQYFIRNPAGTYLIAKMKYCKIWDNNDNLVRDMVAVRNNISNKYGMYDKISKQFFGNSGSGDFSGGNDDYTRVDYIQSSGTQYIDTGIKVNSENRIFRAKYRIYDNSSGYCLFGTENDEYSTHTRYSRLPTMLEWDCYSGAGNGRIAYSDQYEFGALEEIELGNNYIKDLNTGNILQTGNIKNLSYPEDIWLFGANSGGRLSHVCTAKLYYFQIIDNDVVVCDFIPVRNTQTNEYGLYDKVSKQFFGNSGSGDFSGGND